MTQALQDQNKIHIRLHSMSQEQLHTTLEDHHIKLNPYARQLMDSPYFVLPKEAKTYTVTLVTLSDLGLTQGANLPQIFERAQAIGYDLCPLVLAPYMRLELLDQVEGEIDQSESAIHQTPKQNQAPAGSITIASPIPSNQDDFPKGFYLRKINGDLWLRGYRASLDFIWDPEDTFAFCLPSKKSLVK